MATFGNGLILNFLRAVARYLGISERFRIKTCERLLHEMPLTHNRFRKSSGQDVAAWQLSVSETEHANPNRYCRYSTWSS
jgi:hypothetical protein